MNIIKLRMRLFLCLILFLSMPSVSSLLLGQEKAEPSKSESKQSVEQLSAEDFTLLLKQVWSFLKDETENHLASIDKKSEFETTKEFEQRTVDSQRQYYAKVIKYSRDQKLHQRTLSIRFKATLDKYDADLQMYSIRTTSTIDVPYNIPTVTCAVPNNPYLAVADSIKKGYRTSSLHLNLRPDFKWRVSRDVARAAKSDEADMYFQVQVMIDIESGNTTKEAMLGIVPKHIALLNTKTNQIYWEQTL